MIAKGFRRCCFLWTRDLCYKGNKNQKPRGQGSEMACYLTEGSDLSEFQPTATPGVSVEDKQRPGQAAECPPRCTHPGVHPPRSFQAPLNHGSSLPGDIHCNLAKYICFLRLMGSDAVCTRADRTFPLPGGFRAADKCVSGQEGWGPRCFNSEHGAEPARYLII